MDLDRRREYLRHVRSAHSTLMTVSFLVLVAAYTAPKALVGRALAQLDDVVLLASRWQGELGADLRAAAGAPPASKLILQAPPENRSFFETWTWTTDWPGVWFRAQDEDIAYPPPFLSTLKKNNWYRVFLCRESGAIAVAAQLSCGDEPLTLERFERSWDALASLRFVVSLQARVPESVLFEDYRGHTSSETISAIWEKEKEKEKKTSPDDDDEDKQSERDRLDQLRHEIMQRDQHWEGGDVVVEFTDGKPTARFRQGGSKSISWPTESSQRRFDFVRWAVQLVESADSAGAFHETFSHLAAKTSEIRSMKVEEVRKRLKSLQRSRTPSIEWLGASFPHLSFVRWGILVLAAVQIYFLRHLTAARSLQGNGDTNLFPWIGLYSDLLASAAFVLSVALLPLAAAIYCAHVGKLISPDPTARLAMNLGTVVTASVVGATVRSYLRLKRTVAGHPAAANQSDGAESAEGS